VRPTGLGVRYGPHLAALSVGYVVFSYAAVPSHVMATFDVGFTAVGLLMSAALVSFVAVQAIGGRIVNDRSTHHVLLATVFINAVLAIVLDLATSFPVVLGLRAAWGLVGGLTVTVCATHISRVYAGPIATWHQSLNGGMFTFGGAVAFLVTPQVVAATGWFGVHAVGALVALPAFVLLWLDRDRAAETAPKTDRRPSDTAARSSRFPTIRNRIVLLAAACNAATLGAYITLSTFVTSYFDDIGVVAPLNALALLVASFGRFGGGVAIVRPEIRDGQVIAAASGVGAAGLLALVVGQGVALLILPLVALAAVSLPFGAIFKTTASAAERDGTAVAIVVAAGNGSALVLPAVAGWLRDVTGSYDAAFVLLALLNLGAAAAAIAIARRAVRDGSVTEPDAR
jgi:MFS family permease